MGQLTGTPIRRRRSIYLALLSLLVISIYLFSDRILAPESNNGSTSPRARIAKLADRFRSSGNPSINEVYGLIHLVTHDSEKSQQLLNTVDASQPLDVGIYAQKRGINWEKEVQKLNEIQPLVIFSKTYCPFSRKAKQLLETYQLSPPPKIIEVDLREDAAQLKIVLTKLTRRSTFPNVLLRGKSIGGSDDVHALHQANALKAMFEEAGMEILGEYMM